MHDDQPFFVGFTRHHAVARRFEAALAATAATLVRLSTETSGCTGYAYVPDLVDEPAVDDVVLQPGEKVTLAVDPEALELLRGTEIDLAVEGINRVVKFNNPNVVAECGCGESFSVS